MVKQEDIHTPEDIPAYPAGENDLPFRISSVYSCAVKQEEGILSEPCDTHQSSNVHERVNIYQDSIYEANQQWNGKSTESKELDTCRIESVVSLRNIGAEVIPIVIDNKNYPKSYVKNMEDEQCNESEMSVKMNTEDAHVWQNTQVKDDAHVWQNTEDAHVRQNTQVKDDKHIVSQHMLNVVSLPPTTRTTN